MAKKWKRRPEYLLLPNIPLPLHGVNPRSVLGNSWWNSERKEAYARTNYHCESCGTPKEKTDRGYLEGHEVYHTEYTTGQLTYLHTTPLCTLCHNYIHDGRMYWLLQEGKITRARYVKVIQHGDLILEAAGLKRKTLEERDQEIVRLSNLGRLCPWNRWRLVVNGSEYGPKLTEKEYNAQKSRH